MRNRKLITFDVAELEIAPSISFHALQDRIAPNTLRIEGQLNGVKALVLIDIGSTQFFLRVARHVKLPIEPSRHMNVTIGNGEEFQCEGLCQKVSVSFGESKFDIDVHLLPIYGEC